MTTEGARQVGDLVGRPFTAIVDGMPYGSGDAGFFATGHKPVLTIYTQAPAAAHRRSSHPQGDAIFAVVP